MPSNSSNKERDQNMQNGDIAELRKWYRQLIKMNPKDQSAWLKLADTFEDPADQVFTLQEYLKIYSGDELAKQKIQVLRQKTHSLGNPTNQRKLISILDKSIPVSTPTSNNKYILEFSILSGVLVIFLVVALFALTRIEGSFLYRPNERDAFEYIKSIVNRDLLTFHPYGGGLDCDHRPDWYHLYSESLMNDTYWIKGAVVSGNWECIKDVSQFYAKVNYSKEDKRWELISNVTYINPCIIYPEKQCTDTHWDTDWQTDQ